VNSILRAAAVYLFLLVVFRLAGKRTLSQITTFDAILLLIISEAIQQALIDTDNSMTNAFLIVVTLVGLDVLLTLWKMRSARFERLIDGLPVIVIADGKVRREEMRRERIDEADVLAAARSHQGLERLDQIKYAVIEQSGEITVVPTAEARG
jgi:uncharacterized membrane protein YcaP (DUF421 family)